jgi:PIN domain nuclease of toxin-antitoxin system
MRLLLDTHIFLWSIAGSAALKADARRMIQQADTVFVSAASLWEIAIKTWLGKLKADPDALVAAIDESGFVELPVSAVHAAGVAKLPAIHKDPFDRLLIAQSVVEPLRFLTADAALKAYGDLITVTD